MLAAMATPVGGPPNLARVALAALLLAGCTPTPRDSDQPPASIKPTQAPATTPASPPPASPPPSAPATGVRIDWELSTASNGVAYGLQDGIHGPGGWVLLGSCAVEACTPGVGDSEAITIFSDDLSTWTAAALPNQQRRTNPAALVLHPDGYLVFGTALDMDDEIILQAHLQLLRSTDGRTWTQLSRAPLPKCPPITNCSTNPGVGVLPSGAIVAGDSFDPRASKRDKAWAWSGPRISLDGVDWRRVQPSRFGLEALHVSGIASTGTDVFLTGSECPDCSAHLWRSTDGEQWDLQQTGDLPPHATISVAGGVGRVVMALVGCQIDGSCELEIWSSPDGGPWMKSFERPGVRHADLTFTDDAFVLGAKDPFRAAFWVSGDGTTWSNVGAPNEVEATCEPSGAWVAGGSGVVITPGESCEDSWVGRVQGL